MKKNKLKLDDFKVSSFVTLSDDAKANTVKGGFFDVITPGPGDTALCGPSRASYCPDCEE